MPAGVEFLTQCLPKRSKQVYRVPNIACRQGCGKEGRRTITLGHGRMRKPLSAAYVAKLTKPGRYAVGDGVYLQITEWHNKTSRAWLLRFQLNGRARHMGLGPYGLVTLAEARAKARDARRLLLDKIDPIEARRAQHRERLIETARGKTFRECGEGYIASHEAGWRDPRSHKQWVRSLISYVYPRLGDLPVTAIDTALVLAALEPIWKTKPETASRVRGRIESILDWAKARGYRDGENPARWRGHLDHLLPAPNRVRRVKHFAALPYAELPTLMVKLRDQQGVPAAALDFLILTAARSNEVLAARWNEIDGNVWTVPAERMKSGKPHRVPLSDRAVKILASLKHEGEFIFVGAHTDAASNPHQLKRVLHRMGYDNITVHGFRSTFRDWAAETTAYPNHVVEQALAHAIGNGVEAAYRRGDLFEKRRRLMGDWARFCSSSTARSSEVVTLRSVS
jgi:integrase